MFIRLNVFCEKDDLCHQLFVPIDNIYLIIQMSDKQNPLVKSLVKLTNNEEYLCADDHTEIYRILNTNNKLLT